MSEYLRPRDFLGNGPGQIALPEGQWNTLVRLGALPGPDHGELYSQAVIEAAKQKIGPRNFGHPVLAMDWAKDAVGRCCRTDAAVEAEIRQKIVEGDRLRAEEQARREEAIQKLMSGGV